MTEMLYKIMGYVAKIHSYILRWNDANEMNFTDKQLHFWVIGILGLAMIFVVHPIFKYLAANNHIMIISWIYVFTLIIVITFAIEIGQKITGTGAMEFEDIMFGVVGFLMLFGLFAIIRGMIKAICHLIDLNNRE